MSLLQIRDPNLAKNIGKYPDIIQGLISFLTEPRVVALLEAGGKYRGSIVINIIDGKPVSMVPGMELKIGKEIAD